MNDSVLYRTIQKIAEHVTKELGGLQFRIDRPEGSTKEWPGGKKFTYPCDYGYVPNREEKGGDGESLDAFVGDNIDGHLESFQKLRRDGNKMVPDETKFLLGVDDAIRAKIYKLYGSEVNARRVYDDWDAVKAAMKKLDGKHRNPPVAKKASKANPWAEVTPEGPIVGEDTDYEHARARMKFALLTEVNDRETSPDNVPVTGAQDQVAGPRKAPSSKLMGPPSPPKRPEPIQVPQSSKPQILRFKPATYNRADGFVQPLDMSVPDASNTVAEPDPNRVTQEGAQRDLISRFFVDQLDSHRNVPHNAGGVSESAHGAITPADATAI